MLQVSACTNVHFHDLETILQAWELINIRYLELSIDLKQLPSNLQFSGDCAHSMQAKADQLTLSLACFEVSLPAQLLMTQR